MRNGTAKLIAVMKEAQGDLTLTEFAERLGMAQSTISMVYGGNRRPGRKLLASLSAFSEPTQRAVQVFLQDEITTVLVTNDESESPKELA